ncbi:hypothetical protein PG997_000968 [Apiospora hydei]|uniref:Uncharacterized protein n=1 Tax=Apiospora hydei TaxID=1337664 RepID=A0ABR1XC85_9PEZI
MFPFNETDPISGPTWEAGKPPQPNKDGSKESSEQKGGPKVEKKEAPELSFSVEIDYLLAAHRDDVPDDWVYGQSPPPFVYPTARVPEAGGKDDAATRLRARHRYRDVTHDARAWAWRVEVGPTASGTKPIAPPPEWLRSSIAPQNRWLGVRITSPAMWAGQGGGRERKESFRYIKHILSALAQALVFKTPEGCGMAVSVGVGKRAFALNELQRLAAGFFVSGHLLSALPYHQKPQPSSPKGQSSGGGGVARCVSNAIDSKLAFDLRRQGVKGKADSKALADAPFLYPSMLVNNSRTIPRGTLPLPQPQKLNYLAAASKRLFGTATPEEVGTLMQQTEPGRPPAVDFRHYREGHYRDERALAQRKTTIACRQLGATTDAESVAVWCDLVTRMTLSLLTANYGAWD